MASSVKTKGLREFIRAADAADKETRKLVRGRLREIAEPVLSDARAKLSQYDARSAARLGISVRRVGLVAVEQRQKKTTGLRPNFGSLQMREALIPALAENEDGIERSFEKAVDDIADHFGRR